MQLLDLVKNGSFLEVDVKNVEELFQMFSKELLEKDAVTDGFLDAITRRERQFPTGIQLDGMAIALPHIDAEYVKTNALVVRKLKNPIFFQRMDKFDEVLPVQIVFLLLINDVKTHTKTIANLTRIWTNKELMNAIMEVESHQDFIVLLENNGIQ